ncbi:MAG: hypothetical protein A4S14_14630 [Proteobacteria bacterium SG_bin9]|nr:MAG: hypothetical protein A4S14_14630 [Proteobacteria bacterium SG_bin9]
MPGSDSEAAKGARAKFAALLDDIMTKGIRPGRKLRWTNEALADSLGNAATTISNWRNGLSLPERRSLNRLAGVFFGKNPDQSDPSLEPLRVSLQELWKAATSFSERGRTAAPPQQPALFRVPSSIDDFTGRTDEVQRMDAFFAARPKRPWLAVHGMAGVGKTVLVARYAREGGHSFEGVWWCSAETRQALLSSLKDLASKLGVASPPDSPIEVIAQMALHEVARAHPRSCIVYDNAGLLSDFNDLLPAEETALIITTHISDWTDLARSFPIDVLSETVAISFLQVKARRDDPNGAAELAFVLGYLPLALSHAAATCAQMKLAFSAYATKAQQYIDVAPPNARYPKSVLATFKMAIDAIPTTGSALRVLFLLSFFGPERISRSVIDTLLKDEHDGHRAQALLNLETFSLIRNDPFEDGENAYVIHRLVQEVGRALQHTEGRSSEGISQVVHCLRSLFPDMAVDETTFRLCSRLVPHVWARWLDQIDRTPITEDWIGLMVSAGHYLCEVRDYRNAGALTHTATIQSESHLESGSAVWLNAFFAHAKFATINRDWPEAIRLYQRMLEVASSGQYVGHDLAAFCGMRLGGVMQQAGRNREALEALKQVLAIYEAKPETEPFLVIECLIELGEALFRDKQTAAAEEVLLRAARLADHDDHPELRLLSGAYAKLSMLYAALGQPDKALDYSFDAAKIGQQVFPEGPELALKILNLGQMYAMQKVFLEAQRHLEYALEIAERWGPQGFLMTVRDELRRHFTECSDLYRARDLALRQLQDQNAEHGPTSLESLWMRRIIAGLSLDLGEAGDAAAHCLFISDNCDEALPDDHPLIADNTEILIGAMQSLGLQEEAKEVRQRFPASSSSNDRAIES